MREEEVMARLWQQKFDQEIHCDTDHARSWFLEDIISEQVVQINGILVTLIAEIERKLVKKKSWSQNLAIWH